MFCLDKLDNNPMARRFWIERRLSGSSWPLGRVVPRRRARQTCAAHSFRCDDVALGNDRLQRRILAVERVRICKETTQVASRLLHEGTHRQIRALRSGKYRQIFFHPLFFVSSTQKPSNFIYSNYRFLIGGKEKFHIFETFYWLNINLVYSRQSKPKISCCLNLSNYFESLCSKC